MGYFMEKYFGTKELNAKPMNLGDYNLLRGWATPDNEDPTRPGYLVEYEDGGESNHEDYNGYISWSPAEVFEKVYRSSGTMSLGHAMQALKLGKKVYRKGWNGKNMFLFLVPGSKFSVNRPPLLGIYPQGTEINYNPHIDIRNADGSISTWSPSNGDALADDWCLLQT